ncbi:FERM domain-containing protein 8 isoform X3 [Strix uralensis]|uniref:FERM domain-containing protein 8 isoform X3 n=1 Tax=Strix uralensis TaxID=36305 RepID=UPI003DA58C5D
MEGEGASAAPGAAAPAAPAAVTFLPDGARVPLPLEPPPGPTAAELLRRLQGALRLPPAAGHALALWMASPLLEVQLKPRHRPLRLARQWPDLLLRLSLGSPRDIARDEPCLQLRRNVFFPKSKELEAAAGGAAAAAPGAGGAVGGPAPAGPPPAPPRGGAAPGLRPHPRPPGPPRRPLPRLPAPLPRSALLRVRLLPRGHRAPPRGAAGPGGAAARQRRRGAGGRHHHRPPGEARAADADLPRAVLGAGGRRGAGGGRRGAGGGRHGAGGGRRGAPPAVAGVRRRARGRPREPPAAGVLPPGRADERPHRVLHRAGGGGARTGPPPPRAPPAGRPLAAAAERDPAAAAAPGHDRLRAGGAGAAAGEAPPALGVLLRAGGRLLRPRVRGGRAGAGLSPPAPRWTGSTGSPQHCTRHPGPPPFVPTPPHTH